LNEGKPASLGSDRNAFSPKEGGGEVSNLPRRSGGKDQNEQRPFRPTVQLERRFRANFFTHLGEFSKVKGEPIRAGLSPQEEDQSHREKHATRSTRNSPFGGREWKLTSQECNELRINSRREEAVLGKRVSAQTLG